MKKLFALLCLCSAAGFSAFAQTSSPTVVRFHTSLGDVDVTLLPDHAPRTVDNFLGYVDRGDYEDSFIHRSVPGFVIQGGGFYVRNNQRTAIPTRGTVPNEPYYSNVRGTIAMAKLGGDPNSATSQWFFNLTNNAANLDYRNGGFTVFGQVTNSRGLAVLDAIAALQVVNDSGSNPAWDQLPVINYRSGAVSLDNLCYVESITEQPAPIFFQGEVPLDNDVYFLQFPNGNYFGYYSYLSDANYLYHLDLGYEYVFDAEDGDGGVYLYDFDSGSYFYTSPTFPFPYLYDFSLRSVLYYYPADNNGSYTTNPRYFYNFRTGETITK